MKKVLLIISLLILVTGCSFVNIDKQSYDEIIDSVLVEGKKLKNVSLEGYSYYLPKGVILKNANKYNSILYYNHRKMYLYVDVVSYYHKIDSNYEITDGYVSISIDKNGKKGYLEITQLDGYYFVEFMYNYAKIEANVLEKDLKKTITQMAYILNNVNYNDSVLATVVGENVFNYNEEVFNIFKSKRDTDTFLKFEELYQYDAKKDEDTIDLGDDTK